MSALIGVEAILQLRKLRFRVLCSHLKVRCYEEVAWDSHPDPLGPSTYAELGYFVLYSLDSSRGLIVSRYRSIHVLASGLNHTHCR